MTSFKNPRKILSLLLWQSVNYKIFKIFLNFSLLMAQQQVQQILLHAKWSQKGIFVVTRQMELERNICVRSFTRSVEDIDQYRKFCLDQRLEMILQNRDNVLKTLNDGPVHAHVELEQTRPVLFNFLFIFYFGDP